MSKSFRIALLVLVLCVTVLAVAFPLFARQRENARSSGCRQNLKQLSVAMAQYTKDFGGRFPVAQLGWANALQPYLRTQSLGCASDTSLPNVTLPQFKSSGQYNGYWYNGNLSGVLKAALPFPEATLLQGEGNDGTDVKDVRYNKKGLPAAWLTDDSAPCWRHSGGANYLYTDGHVQWLKPNQVAANFGRSNCFAIR